MKRNDKMLWEIRVGRKQEILAELTVPMYKLEEKGLDEFLRALVVRYRTNNAGEMLNYFVNKRQGNPSRLSFADVRACWDFDRLRIGRLCGTWDCYAVAEWSIDKETATALRRFHEQNKSSLPPPATISR